MSEYRMYHLSTDIEPECDYYTCDNLSTGLWSGLTVDEVKGYRASFVATYCKKHEKEHADPNKNLSKIGAIEEQE